MKTRIISTEIWDEEKVFCLNIDTKLFYLILLTNPYIGQSRFYKISDRQLSTFSGLNVEQIKKCQKDLEDSKMAFFRDGYVCVTGYGFVECFYKGKKNEIAKANQIAAIPKDIMDFFKKKLDTLSIPYGYSSDTPLNHKSKIINHKSGIINLESEEELNNCLTDVKQDVGHPVGKKDTCLYSEFKNVRLSEEEYLKLVDRLGEKNTAVLIEQLGTYLASTGKRYKSHYATLLGWARRKVQEVQSQTKNKIGVVKHV